MCACLCTTFNHFVAWKKTQIHFIHVDICVDMHYIHTTRNLIKLIIFTFQIDGKQVLHWFDSMCQVYAINMQWFMDDGWQSFQSHWNQFLCEIHFSKRAIHPLQVNSINPVIHIINDGSSCVDSRWVCKQVKNIPHHLHSTKRKKKRHYQPKKEWLLSKCPNTAI